MISFIVPTLWKSEKIHESVTSFLLHNTYGAEFIIIDNASSDYMHKGITVVKPDRDLYVNAAWNLGVRMAKHDVVCLLNDDITFNFKTLFNNLSSLLYENPNFGIIAFDQTNFTSSINNDEDVLSLIKTTTRGLGFGCMMIMRKHNYVHIPETMLVFSGDDYLYYYNYNLKDNECYNIHNFKCIGEFSATSKNMDELLQKEANIFQDEIQILNIKYKNHEHSLHI